MTVGDLIDQIDELRKAHVLTLDAVVQVIIYRPDGTGAIYPANLAAGHESKKLLSIYAEAGGDFPP
jgi:hypothetical protein